MKVGDRVRCIKDSTEDESFNLPLNEIFIVEEITAHGLRLKGKRKDYFRARFKLAIANLPKEIL